MNTKKESGTMTTGNRTATNRSNDRPAASSGNNTGRSQRSADKTSAKKTGNTK